MTDFAIRLDDVRRRFRAGDYDDAAELGTRLLDEAMGGADTGAAARDPSAVAAVAVWLVRVARAQSRSDQGLRLARLAIDGALTAGDAALECQARVQHARVLDNIGQTREALEECYAALRVAASIGTPLAEAQAVEALGAVQWTMAQWNESLESYRRLAELARLSANPDMQATAHGGIGGVLHHLGQIAAANGEAEQARAHFRAAAVELLAFRRLAEAQGDALNTANACNNHALVLMEMGDDAGARTMLDDLLTRTGQRDTKFRGAALLNLGEIAVRQQSHEAGVARYREALALAERVSLPHIARSACLALANTFEAMGELQAALDHHRRYHALYVQLASQSAQMQAQAMAVKYDTDSAHAIATAQRERADRFESSHGKLSVETERLERLALEDPLTGIGNRRRFDQALREADATRGYSVALLDIDHFKHVNDTCSHVIGDAVLRRLGAIMAANVRSNDVPARYGGEEFGLLLNGLDPGAARHVCERVRLALQAEDWRTLHPSLAAVTVSIGLAHQRDGVAAQQTLALADRRLYAAKHGGRNRTVDQGCEDVPDEAITVDADAQTGAA